MIIAGCNSRIPAAFAQHKKFWLDTVPVQNLGVDGFALRPETMAPDQQRISSESRQLRSSTMEAR